MGFPPWFQEAMQGRLEEVSARIEYQPELQDIRAEAAQAFRALFEGKDSMSHRG